VGGRERRSGHSSTAGGRFGEEHLNTWKGGLLILSVGKAGGRKRGGKKGAPAKRVLTVISTASDQSRKKNQPKNPKPKKPKKKNTTTKPNQQKE